MTNVRGMKTRVSLAKLEQRANNINVTLSQAGNFDDNRDNERTKLFLKRGIEFQRGGDLQVALSTMAIFRNPNGDNQSNTAVTAQRMTDANS